MGGGGKGQGNKMAGKGKGKNVLDGKGNMGGKGQGEEPNVKSTSRHQVVYAFAACPGGADWLPKNDGGADVYVGFWFHDQPNGKIMDDVAGLMLVHPCGQWFYRWWTPHQW